MKKINSLKIAALALFSVLCLAGCRAGGYTIATVTPAPSATTAPTDTPTDTPTPTVTDTPTPTPVTYLDSLGITGLTAFNTEENSISHLVDAAYEVQYEGETYNDYQIASDGKGRIVLLCSHVETPADGEYVYAENRDYSLFFMELDGDRIAVMQRVDLGTAQYCWLTGRSDRIMITIAVADADDVTHQSIRFFDYEGTETSDAAISDEITAGSFYLSGNSDCYYVGDYETHAIVRVDIATGEKKAIDYDEKLYLKSVYGVSTIGGCDYICASFMGGDFNTYQGIINAETGETLYLAADSDISYISSETDKIIINGRYTDDYGKDSTIFDGTHLITYHQDAAFNYTYDLLQDELVVLYTSYESHDEEYEWGEGETYTYTVIDSTATDIALVDPLTGVIGQSNRIATSDNKYLSQICYADTDKVLAIFSDEAGGLEVYIWTLDEKQHSDFTFDDVESIKVEPYTGFTVAEVGGPYTSDDFIAGTCGEDLAEARAYADQMEEKYGIKIYIGPEVKCLMGGYLFVATEDKDLLMDSLTTMDTEFAKYPDGFFSLYKKMESYPNGLSIYFTGDLISYEDDNLSQAGGLRTEENGTIIIALDCDDGRYEAAVHHEISHSIENLIKELGETQLDEDYWNGINVKYGGDRTYYANSYLYQDADYYYGYKDNYKYTYQSWDWYPDNQKEVLFMDDYAMTYPTEDRSRLFEYVMWDSFDLSEYPAMYEKFEYYAGLIKAMLEKNGIDPSGCYWNWVLKENTTGTEE